MTSLVLFDLDGTVLDGIGLPEALRTTCAVLAADRPGTSAADLVAANTAVWERRWPEVEADYMLGGRSGDDIGRDVWRETLAECGIADAAALDAAVEEWDRRERASFRLFPDVLPVLDALRRQGARVGMVTNGAGSVQRKKLEALGIMDRFDPIVISSEVGATKPDPVIFEIALHTAGVAAADTSFVGDNLWHDMPGALSTGIRAIWLDREDEGLVAGSPRPDAVIRSLEALHGSAETG